LVKIFYHFNTVVLCLMFDLLQIVSVVCDNHHVWNKKMADEESTHMKSRAQEFNFKSSWIEYVH